MKELPLPTHSSPQPTLGSTQPFPSPEITELWNFSSRVEGGFARKQGSLLFLHWGEVVCSVIFNPSKSVT